MCPRLILLGWAGQIVAAAHAHPAVQQAVVLEGQQDLLQEFCGDMLALGDLTDLDDGAARFCRRRQVDHGPQAVFTAFG